MDAAYSAEEHFRRGEAALTGGEPDLALGHFRSCQRLDPTSPRYRSYYGLALAISEHRFDKALELCRSAAKEEFFNPALYHNLARVHLTFGFKAEAIRHLRRGQMIDPGNPAIEVEMARLGVRRQPVFNFLRRRHVLNRWLGALFRGPEAGAESQTLARDSAAV
jgi:tetratricopeptide (TPR) repeat protein